MAKKATRPHGGKRKGAGRKVGGEGPAVIVAASVPTGLVERFDAYRDKTGLSRSQAVTEAIRGLLGEKP